MRNLNISCAKHDFVIAEQCFDEALLLTEKTKSTTDINNLKISISNNFTRKGNYKKSLELLFRLKKAADNIKYIKGTTDMLGEIGVMYWRLGDSKNALYFLNEDLKLTKQTKIPADIAAIYNNMGLVHRSMNNYKTALFYYTKAVNLFIENKIEDGLSDTYNNIGVLFQKQDDYFVASYYFDKSLQICYHIGDSIGISIALGNLGDVNTSLGKYDVAEKYLKNAFGISTRQGDLEGVMEVGHSMSTLYEKTKRMDLAFSYFKLYISARDTINSAEFRKEALIKEMEFKFDQEEQKKAIEAASEKKRQQQYTYMVLVILFIVLIFSFVLYTRFNLTKKQKSIIESQKQLVEEKQKEVLASIAYAKRLQEAILPPQSLILENLPQSFILYKPKDIVAGDFYWIEVINKDYLLMAAADCTGHGVPGALVSVVCSNALNRTVKEFEITEPGKVLDKARELVVETFERSETEVKDGMDISLCLLNKKTLQLEWAGANNPLWIVREGNLIELKPNKQAIGKVDKPVLYGTHKLKLQKDDCIYIFTDGYADQFGGPKGKKFKYKQLSELLVQIQSLNIKDQKEKLDSEFENWKGSLEQIDDVCLIGIKI